MKKLLLKIKLFFITLFGDAKRFEQIVSEHIDEAIKIAARVRELSNSAAALTVVNLTKTKLDNQALAMIRTAAEKVIEKLTLFTECTKHVSFDEKMLCFIQSLQQQSPAVRDALTMKFASLLAAYKSGQTQLAQNIWDTAVQSRFFEQKTNI